VKTHVRNRRTKLILFAAFLVAAAVLGALMLQKYHDSKRVPATPAHPGPADRVRITLFFAAPDGDGLMREGSEIDSCRNDLAACIRSTLAKLVSGPLGDLAPALPPSTIINSVQVQGDTAYLDFSKELADGIPGGSSSEMTAVYAVVDTVSFNFPQIKKVKFLLDGRDVESLAGHLDLRMPLEPDFGMEKDMGGQSGPQQK
jgi:hypothetical protein